MNKDFNQVIIGGLQRSGTSLIRAVIGSHPEISIYQWDLPLWIKFSVIYSNRVLTEKQKLELINDVITHTKAIACNVNFTKEDFNSILNIEQKKTRNSFFTEFYSTFLTYYLNATKGKYIGLKTPHNEFYVDDIFKQFPKTKFIHVIRNPLDVAVSLVQAKKKWWGGKTNYYSHIRLWKESTDIAYRNIKKYKENYYILKYEDFILHPLDNTIKLCKFIGVDFNEDMLLMNDHPGWKGSNSSFSSKSGEFSINSSSIDQYKQKLELKIQNKYFFFLNKNLRQFEYECPDFFNESSNSIIKYRINNILQAVKEKGIDKIRRSIMYKPLKNWLQQWLK